MFANLIESQSHLNEFRRRGRFVLATTAVYAVLLFAAGIASIYAYDPRLEIQNTGLEVLNWVPPVATAPVRPTHERPQPVRRSTPSSAPIDRHITIPERVEQVASVADPRSTPETIGINASKSPPVTGIVNLTGRNADPQTVPKSSACVTCTSDRFAPVVVETTPPPAPTPVKLQIQKLPSTMLMSKVISLPQPPYPPLAKQIGIHGPVPVQILIDEGGKVVSARALSGNAFLTKSAEEAAYRARFTPTILNGQSVKVQGVITYNFVLQ
jgi:protein TonB